VLRIESHSRKWWVLGAMGGVLGIVLLDETVVGVALPTIIRELGLRQVTAHWVINAYLLVFAGLAAAAGRLGDILGLKALFIIGILIFGLASLVSGFAESGSWLITARAVQGIGAAVIFPASMAMITHAFPPKQRGVAIGIYGSIGTFFISLGPLVGGFFSEFLSWRWIFWINPPIAVAIALVVLAVWRDPRRDGDAVKLDAPGLLTLVAGLGLVVFAIMEGPDWGWSRVSVWVLLVAGTALLIGFISIERRAGQPLIDVTLFQGDVFTTLNLVIFVAQFSKIAVFVFVALYLQKALGFGALIAGIVLLSSTVPTLMTAYPTGRLLDRIGARALIVGGSAASGTAVLWLAIAVQLDNYAALLPALIVWGACQSILFVPALRGVMNAVPADKRGEAGGISMSAQLLGGTVGMTVCGTLYAATSLFGPIFAVTGCLILGVLAMSWITIKSPTRS
jgi:EmrB/QacA subfamily drug resistance transporter